MLNDLIARLTHRPPTLKDIREAADALEAQARRIAELERIAQKQADALNVLRGSIAAYQVGKHEARISELEAQLSAGNDWLNARHAVLQDLSEANARIEELEKELAAERTVIACAPRGWHD